MSCDLSASPIALLAFRTLGVPWSRGYGGEAPRDLRDDPSRVTGVTIRGFLAGAAAAGALALRACSDFLNWWNAGYAGAEMLRFNYVNAVQATSRRFMPADEYAYWLEGKPAARSYKSPAGDIVARRGDVRDGGAFTRRACRIANWNSWSREVDHLHQRWFEFASTF